MKHWEGSLEAQANSVPSALRSFDEFIIDLVNKLARKARSHGIRVSTAELVELARILSIYATLRGGTLTNDDIVFVSCSVLCKRKEDSRKFSDFVLDTNSQDSVKDIIRGIKSDLEKLGVGPSSSINLRGRLSDDVQAAYARLRLLGVIKSKGPRARVVSEKAIKDIARRLARSSSSYREAVASAITGKGRNDFVLSLAARLGSELPYYVDLGKLGIEQLARIYRYARSRPLRRHVASVLSRIAASRNRLSENEARLVLDIAIREKMLDEKLLNKLIKANPRLIDRLRKSISSEELLDIALSDRGNENSVEIAAKALGVPPVHKKALRVILTNNVLLEKARKKELGSTELALLSKIAEAREMLFRSILSQGEQAYRDYALAELEKAKEMLSQIKDREVLTELRKIYERVSYEASTLMTGNNYAALKSLVRDLSFTDAVKLLSSVASSTDSRTKHYAMRLLYIITRRYAGLFSKGRRAAVAITRSGFGRISTRHTIHNIVRMKPNPVTVRSSKRTKSIVLVIDKSGSMRDYAIAALLSAAALAPLVKRIVFFDENIYVLNKLSRVNIHKLIELVFSTQFRGYTNIVSALDAAVKGISASKLVLISDLKQTVKPYTETDVCNQVAWIQSSGWRVVILTPSNNYPSCLDGTGARVITVDSINAIERALLRL